MATIIKRDVIDEDLTIMYFDEDKTMYNKAIRTGELKAHNGLVDYIAEGYIKRGIKEIPVEIGYLEYTDTVEAAYIFIKNGDIKETINLRESCLYDADDINIEEVE